MNVINDRIQGHIERHLVRRRFSSGRFIHGILSRLFRFRHTTFIVITNARKRQRATLNWLVVRRGPRRGARLVPPVTLPTK